MTEITKKRRKLSVEILLIVALCFALSVMLFLFITTCSRNLIDEYRFINDIYLDEFEIYQYDVTLVGICFAFSALFFAVMFLALFGERLSYIRKITAGVHALRGGDYGKQVVLEGNNELTELACAVNYLSESEERIKAKEQSLSAEKEELIRTLSHDIRTPLTSIMSYTELLQTKESLTTDEVREYLALVKHKTSQIKDLTDILLEGGRRKVEFFDDARLLFEQLADEFESELEEDFATDIEISSLPAFSGSFDVGEMQRVFDNLISNIQKYAEPTERVKLSVFKADCGIIIKQSNGVRKERKPSESFKMGLSSIRRIAQGYGGEVKVTDENELFEIIITLSRI